MGVTRFEVYLVALDPVVGSEMRKTRPCAVVSPPELNGPLRTVIVAPLTTGGRAYRSRVACEFQGRPGHIALDQVRTIDKSRLGQPIGRLTELEGAAALRTLRAIFAD